MPERPTCGTCEHESVITRPGVSHDVRGQVRRDQLGYRHDALTSLGLRRAERESAAVPLVQLPGNPDGPGLDAALRVDPVPAAAIRYAVNSPCTRLVWRRTFARGPGPGS
jgi:hypothetical protein